MLHRRLGFQSPIAACGDRSEVAILKLQRRIKQRIAREMAQRAGANFHPIPIKQSDIAEISQMQSGIRKPSSAMVTGCRNICSAEPFVMPVTK
jgi:hypothetical protein